MVRWVAAAGLALALSGCTSPPAGTSTTTPAPASVSPTWTPPSPDGEIPRDADALATRLADTTVRLDRAIGEWRSAGDPASWPPPDDVVLLALDQQRCYQVLSGSERTRRAVIALLQRELRTEVRTLAGAGSRLAEGSPPVTRTPRLDTTDPVPADVLRSFYEEAEARFAVDWELLAAVHFIETRFGRVVSASTAGAQGPMQFVPSTWEAYGLGGDVHDPRDAILGAANYLSASGAPEDERRALLAYNPVDYYADAVASYARQLRRDPDTFYAFYNWQVFVPTPTGGLKRLTGPGL